MATFKPVTPGASTGPGATVVCYNGVRVARARKKPHDPANERQREARQAFRKASHYWKETLDPGEADGWRDFAAANPVIKRCTDLVSLTGDDWWTGANVALIFAGMFPVIGPPIDNTLPGSYTAYTLTDNGGGSITIDWDAAAWGITGNVNWYVSARHPRWVRDPGNRFRFCGTSFNVPIGSQSITVADPWPASPLPRRFLRPTYVASDATHRVYRFAICDT